MDGKKNQRQPTRRTTLIFLYCERLYVNGRVSKAAARRGKPDGTSNTPAAGKVAAAAGGPRWPLADGDGRCLTGFVGGGLIIPTGFAGPSSPN